MLAVKKDDHSVTALIPSGFSGYTYLDTASGKRVKITKANQGLFEEEAIAFYKPFPLKKMGMKDLLVYMAQTLSTADYVTMLAATLIVTLVGMLLPRLNNILFSTVVASGSRQLLLAIGTFMVCVTISSALLTAMKTLIASRFSTKMGITIEAATMMRILSLPADFFKQYSSGELYARSQYVNILCEQMVTIVMTTGLTSIFSLLYISQIFLYAPALVVPALMVILVTVVFSVVSAFVQMNVSQKQMELATKETGLSYALISGVQKVKLTGAEKRAFAKWGNAYAEQAKYLYNPPLFLKINSALSTAISLVGTLVIYYSAVKSGVSVADYYAFNTAYAVVSGAFLTLAGITTSLAQIKPIMKMIQPILETVPEVSEGKQMVTRLSGAIELNNVSFRYSENMPLVLDNLSLKIRPGQYVAIVGRTGCGKSTLMRLLTGFETPQKGAIYYDGKDLNSLDLKSLRKHIGVVMQNGKLFQGDIYSNIVISAPQLTLDDAWKAAEMAGIADDIRQMPMGMFTLISEGSGGISGGQRQRLMIARAIAPNPKILMFDEATSALDNISQKVVSESLDHLKCTRIVIAHRLSTIQQCDRIIVLDKGKIIEDGTYEDLIAQNGFFAELVARQRLDA
jgi:NHLM bacteriocin system ABC transporter ATP-binding protein